MFVAKASWLVPQKLLEAYRRCFDLAKDVNVVLRSKRGQFRGGHRWCACNGA